VSSRYYDESDFMVSDDLATMICESKQMQVDEMIALEASYADTDLWTVSSSSHLDGMQRKLEEWQANPDDKINSKGKSFIIYLFLLH
jgi:hypothetical protein